jgi:nitroreductase
VLTSIVAAAQSAPSSSNLQVWSVLAIREPERKARLAHLSGGQRQIVEAPLFLVWLIDFDRLTPLSASQDVRCEALDYLETFVLGAVDTALAAQNATVALESLGYGGCYIGGIRNHPEEVAAELNLPPKVFPLFGLTIGRPDPERPASVKPRLPQTSVLYEEAYAWTAEQHKARKPTGPLCAASSKNRGFLSATGSSKPARAREGLKAWQGGTFFVRCWTALVSP